MGFGTLRDVSGLSAAQVAALIATTTTIARPSTAAVEKLSNITPHFYLSDASASPPNQPRVVLTGRVGGVVESADVAIAAIPGYDPTAKLPLHEHLDRIIASVVGT